MKFFVNKKVNNTINEKNINRYKVADNLLQLGLLQKSDLLKSLILLKRGLQILKQRKEKKNTV